MNIKVKEMMSNKEFIDHLFLLYRKYSKSIYSDGSMSFTIGKKTYYPSDYDINIHDNNANYIKLYNKVLEDASDDVKRGL